MMFLKGNRSILGLRYSNQIFKRNAGQEINPIIMRLQRHEPNVPFDRSCVRSWQQVFYAPHRGFPQWNHYAPYYIQGLWMKDYLEGYFHEKALISQPFIYRSVAGNLVRIFVFNLDKNTINYEAIQEALERVFGEFQGPGTSGRSREDNERQGKVKTRLDVIELRNPLFNADIAAQYVGTLLERNLSANIIFDRLCSMVSPNLSRRNPEKFANLLDIAGFRLRIKGRPRGEEMAIKKDYIHGSCPKYDETALMDYGKVDVQLRSGKTGVKVWVNFQRPHLADESGYDRHLNRFVESSDGIDKPSSEDEYEEKLSNFPSLLNLDRDYDPVSIKKELESRNQRRSTLLKPGLSSLGLWNAESITDPEISQLSSKIREIHMPDFEEKSRFIW